MNINFFKSPNDFRKWLEKHHATTQELLVGYYKKSSGRPSMTWPESVNEALCFGWIDGIRRSVDDLSYSIRFTPRKPVSTWSTVNIKRVEELSKKGLMRPAGLKALKHGKRISRVSIHTSKEALSSQRLTKKGSDKTKRRGISFTLNQLRIEKPPFGGW